MQWAMKETQFMCQRLQAAIRPAQTSCRHEWLPVWAAICRSVQHSGRTDGLKIPYDQGSPTARSVLRDDDIHRNIVMKRMDGFDPLRFEADPDGQRLAIEGGKGSVKKSASIAKTEAMWIETDQRCNDDIRNGLPAAGRNRNVPYSAFKSLPHSPRAEYQGFRLGDDNRQQTHGATSCCGRHPSPEVRLSEKRPKQADMFIGDVGNDLIEMGCNRTRIFLALCHRQGFPIVDQPLPLRFSPRRDIQDSVLA
ncbi:hypothetical protein FHT81_006044 [Rhizobium sp. BK252]|nr:hypothetical protein [Rhizobium sp. BK252]MBB3418348.1 hypothetical protein [Rhizobium sp. BK284]